MCLIGLALGAHPRWAFVVAANRDEFFDRPAAPLDWWRTRDDAPWLIGGRDLHAGGTWMGLSASGRIGMLTNVRDPRRQRAAARSRGALVTDWLDHAAWPGAADATGPFNLIGGDLRERRWWWTSDRHAAPVPLAAGVHALSNGALNEPWPKVQRLTVRLRDALDGAAVEPDALVERLFALLADDQPAPDHALPDTGVGLARERRLSPAFIRWPEANYGTRCSTVALGRTDDAGRWQVQVHEHTHDREGHTRLRRCVSLEGWPCDGALATVRTLPLS